ncbi:MAG: hypothetical protein HY040_06190 [Planctomycetes bacterium]|nr:hypothetical protein [Planctomycetota bacterium]
MNVCVRIQFTSPTKEDWQAMRSLAARLTGNRESVRVSADQTPGWLVAEFSMPTEAQYKALPRIERAIKFCVSNRWDSTISFPYTESERVRADRRATRRKALRRNASGAE